MYSKTVRRLAQQVILLLVPSADDPTASLGGGGWGVQISIWATFCGQVLSHCESLAGWHEGPVTMEHSFFIGNPAVPPLDLGGIAKKPQKDITWCSILFRWNMLICA